MTTYRPHGYQEDAEQFLHDTPFCMLAMEMGLGKTVVTATAISKWIRYLEARRVLIIAPKTVALNTWPGELRKWDHLKGLRVSYILGTREQRISGLRADADVYVINRENVQWLCAGFLNAGRPWPFDTVIVDESTGFKSPDAVRWKALAWARPYIRRLVELTGTPLTNSHADLWSQIYLLDGGQRLFPTITAFRNYACKLDYASDKWVIAGQEMKQWVQDRVRDIVLPMRAKDWLDMPELLTIEVPVRLPDAARKLYDKMLDDLTIELRSGQIDITAVNSAVLVGKLAQISNGAIYDEDGAVHHIHDAKLDVLEDLIEAAGGESVMVAYRFKHDLARLTKRFPQAVNVKAPGAIDAWNRGDIPILLLHSASAGHGLNLQDGGRHLIWFGPTYSLEEDKQTIARLWRQGQRNNVIVHRILGEDTVDYDILDILNGKDRDLAGLMADLLRATSRPEIRAGCKTSD